MKTYLVFQIAIWSHVVMGLGVLFGGEPAGWATAVATSLKTVKSLGGNAHLLGLLYLASSMLVLFATWRGKDDLRALLCYGPQQFFMLISAFGAIRAMISSQFADGVIRPMAFIVADQHLWLFIGVAHTIALVYKFALWRLFWLEGVGP